ncbi:MAG: hypothetical protein IKF93_04665 [Lachnospiraceae bacterium]|nr:hypothetical protein [Lachnospiraceae bacterium]
MRSNEFTHIPIKKQTAESNSHPEELDIDFLDYEEVEKQTRPKVGRSTAKRPEPKLQHPAKTPQKTVRPAQPRQTQQRPRPTQPTQQRTAQQRQPQQKQTQQRPQQTGAGQTRPTAQRPQQQQRPQQTRQTAQRPVQSKPVQNRPAQQAKQVQQRSAQQKTTQQRPAQQKPAQQRPQQVRPAQQRPVQQRPVQQRQQTQTGQTRPQQPKRPVTQQVTQQAKRTKAPAVKGKFRKGLLIAWLAFVAVLAAALILLSVFLSNYEKSRPAETIHRIVSAVEKGNLDDLHLQTEDGFSLTDGQILADPAEISAYILQKEEGSEEEEGGITFRVLNGESDENTKVYLIKAGDKKILKTVIERSDKKYAFGFTGWQEKETILLSDAFPVTTLKVQIPQSDQLIVNGKTIGRERVTSEGDRINLISRLIAEGFIGEQPTMDTYEIPGIFFHKDVQATDSSGRTYDCILTADTYTGGFDAPQDFINEQYDRVIDMFEPYAFYFSGEAGRGALARIMLDDSPAYNSAISADVSWMQEHSDVEITEQKAENFKKYSDDVFSCDISFLQTIYQGDDPVKTWDTNMTWVFVRDGEKYYIADFVTRTGDEG